MRTSKLLLLALLLSVFAIPAMAQLNDTYVIPAASNQRGAFGAHWMTRFSIFNPHLDYPLFVSITLIRTNGLQGEELLVELPPNALAYSDNLLDELFEIEGGGALLVATFAEDNPGVPDDILSRSFLVTSDTYNNSPIGTYGQTIPGVWAGLLDYDDDPISSVAHGIRNGGNYRTNIGAVNLGRCNATLYVNVYDANGNTIKSQIPMVLPPLGHFQQLLPEAVSNGSVEFFVDDPCSADDDRFAVVFPYTSTIDRRTNDPAYQQPTLLANPNILFAKGQRVDPTALGKKIDSNIARQVRANVTRRGMAKLTRTDEGWQITK
ncbi:MAG: hypothetical protein ACLGH0_00705 [Thermoanaerobaculia bacterium]